MEEYCFCCKHLKFNSEIITNKENCMKCKDCSYEDKCSVREIAKDITGCEGHSKPKNTTKITNLIKLHSYFLQKQWEYENIENEHNVCNEWLLKGLQIAINIMSE